MTEKLTWYAEHPLEVCAIDADHVAVIRYDESGDTGRVDGCGTPPVIYGSEWWSDRRYGELVSCGENENGYRGCKDVHAPDWSVVKRALDHYGEHVNALGNENSLTRRYLRAYWGVVSAALLTSSIDRYAWAAVLVTESWLEHVGLGKSQAEKNTHDVEVQAYLDGEVFGAGAVRISLENGEDAREMSGAELVDAVEDGEELEMVWGYYGEEFAKESALCEARSYSAACIREVTYTARIETGAAKLELGSVSKTTADMLLGAGIGLQADGKDCKIDVTGAQSVRYEF